MVAQRDKTDKETQTKKRDKSRDKAKPGGRIPAYCGAPAAASRLTAGLPAGPGFSRSPPRQTLNLEGLYTLELGINRGAGRPPITTVC
jgi:hypothetical protein